MKLEQIQLSISGRVQGVGFRYHTKREAERMGITGWVKNVADGSVETLAEGTTEQLEGFMSWCHEGPSGSRVSEIQIRWRSKISARSFFNFEIII